MGVAVAPGVAANLFVSLPVWLTASTPVAGGIGTVLATVVVGTVHAVGVGVVGARRNDAGEE